MSTKSGFNFLEATIADIHEAYRTEALTVRALTQAYLDRIEAYNKAGPQINALTSINPNALADADRLDRAYRVSGLTGPLHGIPVVVKDQADVAEMPTTLGSVLFENYRPGADSFVANKL